MSTQAVIPAQAGTQNALGPRLRGDDSLAPVIPAQAGIQSDLNGGRSTR
jgi:hypothetical protein